MEMMPNVIFRKVYRNLQFLYVSRTVSRSPAFEFCYNGLAYAIFTLNDSYHQRILLDIKV